MGDPTATPTEQAIEQIVEALTIQMDLNAHLIDALLSVIEDGQPDTKTLRQSIDASQAFIETVGGLLGVLREIKNVRDR